MTYLEKTLVLFRYSTASQILDHSMREIDLVSFMKSSLEEPEGRGKHKLQ